MYFNYKSVTIFDVLFYFIVGARGIGKTYGAKKMVIDSFLENKEQFVYVRRYKNELKDLQLFFSDISKEYEDVEFKVKGKEFYINNGLAGFAIPLSTSQQKKSVPYDKVSRIIFDEFILDKGNIHYIANEVEVFLELYSTISRDRDCKVFFLSNALSLINPYFTYFNILDIADGVNKFNDILIYKPDMGEFKQHMSDTRFGKLISGTAYSNYAISNEFLRDDYTKVRTRNGNSKFICKLFIRGKYYGLWLDDTYIISNKYNPNCKILYYWGEIPKDKEFARLKGSYIYEVLKNSYYNGVLYFESLQIKSEVLYILNG